MSIVVIPSFNPDDKLIEIVQKLKGLKLYEIIVVNDGSYEDTAFNQIKQEVTILSHDKNYGKGAAIKTALRYIKQNNINDKILVMDADGQHKTEDGIKLLEELDARKKEIIIGKRNFKQKIPLKSKIGNVISRGLFRIFSGQYIHDTQTGLRAFNSDIIDMLINIKGNRYEYEINMLMQCVNNKIEIKEVDIETIYERGNSSSHYRAISDSLRIGVAFFKSKLYFFLLLLLFAILLVISRLNLDNLNTSNNMLDIKLISNNAVTQGDVIVYKIENEDFLYFNFDTVVEIINNKGTVVENATIKKDKILIDTSMLPAGIYKIKIKYNSSEMTVLEHFKVVLIES